MAVKLSIEVFVCDKHYYKLSNVQDVVRES